MYFLFVDRECIKAAVLNLANVAEVTVASVGSPKQYPDVKKGGEPLL